MDLQLWPLFEAWACMMATICSPLNATKTAMAEEGVFGVYYAVEGDFSPDGKTSRTGCVSWIPNIHVSQPAQFFHI